MRKIIGVTDAIRAVDKDSITDDTHCVAMLIESINNVHMLGHSIEWCLWDDGHSLEEGAIANYHTVELQVAMVYRRVIEMCRYYEMAFNPTGNLAGYLLVTETVTDKLEQGQDLVLYLDRILAKVFRYHRQPGWAAKPEVLFLAVVALNAFAVKHSFDLNSYLQLTLDLAPKLSCLDL